MRKLLFTGLVIGLLSLTWVAAQDWAPTTATVGFTITNAGVDVDGSLSGVRASATFDPANLAKASISASVAANTIKTGIAMRDRHLRSKDYFDVEKYPRISMKSVSFTKTGANSYNGKFQLTMKDVTKTVNIPFTFTSSGSTGKFKGKFKLNRLDYNVGSSSWTLGDNVTVNLVLNTKKK